MRIAFRRPSVAVFSRTPSRSLATALGSRSTSSFSPPMAIRAAVDGSKQTFSIHSIISAITSSCCMCSGRSGSFGLAKA